MKLTHERVEAYLARHFGGDVRHVTFTPLFDSGVMARANDERRSLKTFGYGEPILISFEVGGEERRVVLNTMAANAFGHERRADRAAGILLSYDTFNSLPQHVRALDVGVITSDAGLRTLSDGEEFFLLTDYVDGTTYARDLQRLRDTGDLKDLDVRRTRCLAEYLTEIHAVRRDDDVLYRRRIRDLLGSGEGIMGLTDNYPSDFPLVDAEWLKSIEIACVHWRWYLRTYAERSPRLTQVHGDFHPFNILFYDETAFWVLDRSRGAWGEPADDVSCMAINYLFFSLQRSGAMAPPFQRLWDVFWETYLTLTDDGDILSVVAPFFAWRGLVLASPIWYDIDRTIREALFRFIENVLRDDVFDPGRINEYIR